MNATKNRTKLTPPIQGMETVPRGYPLTLDEWVTYCLDTFHDIEAREAFVNETGCNVESLLRTPAHEMIAVATGRERHVLITWLDWVTRNYWGEERLNS